MYTPEQIQVLLRLGLDPSQKYVYEAKPQKVSCWENPVWLEIQKMKSYPLYAIKKPYKKTTNVYKYIGCTHEEFRTHLEKQFLKGMSWENKDLWHIDHIIPISSAKTIEEVHVLAKFTNLRPLWQKDNSFKKDKRLYLI
jgi:hypothetical protein